MRDLNRKMAQGASWLILFRLLDRSIGFISTMLLARLLVPADFGLVAMAMSVLAFVVLLSAFSFDLALIQNANAERRHYDTAWTFNVGAGLLQGAVLMLLAQPAAQFYGEPRMQAIMVAVGANCMIGGFGNIGVVAFQKELELHKEFVLNLSKRLIGFVATLLLAYWLRNYWALLWATLLTTTVGVVLSYVAHPYRPRLSLAGRHELFHFSKWLLLNNLLVSLTHRLPDLVIGRLADARALGLYTVSYEISNLPTTELVFPISRAVFPAYSKLAASQEALRRGFQDVLSVLLLVTVPAGLGIIALAEPFTYVLLGPKWLEAVPLIQVLGVYGILRAAVSNVGSVYLAVGKPALQTGQAVLFLLIMGCGLWLLVPRLGAMGACYAVVVAAAVQLPFGYCLAARELQLPVRSLLAQCWRPLLGALGMAALLSWLLGAAPFARGLPPAAQLASLVPLGVLVYALLVLGLWHLSGRPNSGEAKLLAWMGSALASFRQRQV